VLAVVIGFSALRSGHSGIGGQSQRFRFLDLFLDFPDAGEVFLEFAAVGAPEVAVERILAGEIAAQVAAGGDLMAVDGNTLAFMFPSSGQTRARVELWQNNGGVVTLWKSFTTADMGFITGLALNVAQGWIAVVGTPFGNTFEGREEYWSIAGVPGIETAFGNLNYWRRDGCPRAGQDVIVLSTSGTTDHIRVMRRGAFGWEQVQLLTDSGLNPGIVANDDTFVISAGSQVKVWRKGVSWALYDTIPVAQPSNTDRRGRNNKSLSGNRLVLRDTARIVQIGRAHV
jgi:hypothetical protein